MVAKRPKPQIVPFGEWLLNVHDVFMNAQLMRELMDRQPVVDGAGEFMTSPRGRLERAAMRDLYVLIEAYQSSPRAYLDRLREVAPGCYEKVASSLADTSKVETLMEVRDYMSHRDVRRYNDIGRYGVAIVGVDWHRRTESAFAELLLTALRSPRPRD